MYAKVFSQIFDSSIADNYRLRHFFMDLMVLSERDGTVDMTPESIAKRTRIPLGSVKKMLDELMQPDPRSRSREHEGRRLIPLDPERSWGWQIVNFETYRDLQNEEERKEYRRNWMKKKRLEEREQRVNKREQHEHTQTEIETETKIQTELTAAARLDAFESVWKNYRNRQGRKNALRHFTATVKTEADVTSIQLAMKNYLRSGNVQRGFIKNGSTWFNEWQDWIDPTPEMLAGNAARNGKDVHPVAKPMNYAKPGEYPEAKPLSPETRAEIQNTLDTLAHNFKMPDPEREKREANAKAFREKR